MYVVKLSKKGKKIANKIYYAWGRYYSKQAAERFLQHIRSLGGRGHIEEERNQHDYHQQDYQQYYTHQAYSNRNIYAYWSSTTTTGNGPSYRVDYNPLTGEWTATWG